MPVIETTMIAGYGPDVKKRLVKAFTRGVMSVMAANPDGVIVILREVDPSCWARGGVSRIPGPALADALEVVAAYAAARTGGDAAAQAELAPGMAAPDFAPRTYDDYQEAYTDDGSLVFASATTTEGKRVLDRYHVRAGKVVGLQSWGGAA